MNKPDPSPYDLARLRGPGGPAAIVKIGIVLAVVVGAFAWVGGWLTPARLSSDRAVDQFEETNGLHAGFRRNHPKGVCFTGWFDSDGAGVRLSKAQVFEPGRTPVFGRFAMANGQPGLPDVPTAVHSMAVDFALKDGETWRAGMNGIPIFTVHGAHDLVDLLAAAAPDPKTGKPDGARIKAFMASHPQTARAMAIVASQPLASGFADTTYNSLDAFLFDNAAGATTPVRWSMVAEDPFVAAKPDPAQAQDPNYQFDELAARVRSAPVRWKLVATLGRPGDPTDDATQAWPADREQVQLGVLTVDTLADEAHGACRDVTFDPLMLPAGIRGSDDPILSARSAAYAESFTRRSGEPAPPPPVPLASGAQGGR